MGSDLDFHVFSRPSENCGPTHRHARNFCSDLRGLTPSRPAIGRNIERFTPVTIPASGGPNLAMATTDDATTASAYPGRALPRHVARQCASADFLDADDHARFLTRLTVTAARFGVRCRAYCLMVTHVHLLLEAHRDEAEVTYAERFACRLTRSNLRMCR
jgi:hypothetical protein